jgi:hypothetical protein
MDKTKIKCRKKISIQMPAGVITETGRGEIQDYLCDLGYPPLPEELEFVWKTDRGTIGKRIASHIYNTFHRSLDSVHISNIGNIAKTHCPENSVEIIDFTKTFDWRPGKFGDRGSCFWSERPDALPTLEYHGAYAMRAFALIGVKSKRHTDIRR